MRYLNPYFAVCMSEYACDTPKDDHRRNHQKYVNIVIGCKM